MARPPALSVCMIVKNEAANLAEALPGIRSFADEIIVVDTGSRDNTKEIAARFTPRLFDFEWVDDFAAARNFALSKATGSYHLWLDADDRVSPAMQRRIGALKSRFDGRKGFFFILENHLADRPPSRCRQLRCTPLVPGLRFEGRVHEQILPGAARCGLELVAADIVIRHQGYMTRESRLAKARRNLAILEKERAQGGDSGGICFFLALTHSLLGNRAEAVRCMEKALELFETERFNQHLIPEGYLFLARISQEMEDGGRALRYLARAGSFANGNPLHDFQRGVLYQNLGRHAEAVLCFEGASGKDCPPGLFPSRQLPDRPEILLHQAYSFFCGNDRQNGLKLIERAAAAGLAPRACWEWLGGKASALQNPDLALLAFETAERLGGLDPSNRRLLGRLYSLRGLSQKAEQCLRRGEIPRRTPS